MLLQEVRSSIAIVFMILCIENKSFGHIIDVATKTVQDKDVRLVQFDSDLELSTKVKYGEHIRLICETDLPFITWKVRHNVMTEGVSKDQWDIKSVNLSLHGEYVTCEAKWQASSQYPIETYGTNFLITDLAKPVISSSTSKNETVVENATKILLCKIVEGVPAPTVTWQFMRRGDHKFRNLTESGENLKIEKASLANTGQYRCIAVNSKGQDNKIIDVTVQKLPVATIKQLENTFPYGNTTEFTCKVQGYPLPKAVWSDNNGNILVSKDSNINWHEKYSVLKLKDMKKPNTYTCTAENALGQAKDAVNVTILSPFVVHEHPNVTTVVSYGTSKTLVCNITSSFPMKKKWFRPKRSNSMELEEINNSNTYMLQPNGDLTIQFMELDTAGNHTCEASLISDVNEKVDLTTDLQIDNLASPVLVIATKIIVMEGNWIAVFCEIASGVPPPTLSWHVMKHGNTEYIELPESDFEKLEFQNISISEAGKYRCIAKNDVGEISKDTEVLVRKAPVMVIEEGLAMSVEYGSNHTFTCRVIAYPLPVIHWESNETLVLSKETTIHEHKKISKIAVAQILRDITYTCYARNLLWHDEQVVTSSINITVLSPFTIHQRPAEITNVHYAASTKLVCNITSSFPMRIRWFHNSTEVHTSDKHVISANQTVLEIPSANLDLVGNYRCEASLVNDDVPKEDFRTTVRIDDLRVPVITSFGEQLIRVKEFEDLTLACKADGNPKPVVTFTAMLLGSYSPEFLGEGEAICSTNIGPGQAGIYICTASNVAGSDIRKTQVIVTN